MVTQVRTIDFLPEIFRTTPNKSFLSATLDQLVQQPNTEKIQGYIGRRFEYGITPNSYYVTEPDKIRTNYQLEPAIVFTQKDTSKATDFITYPEIIDALRVEGSPVNNNSNLFSNEFYSWDSFTDLDKLTNFTQYYWLPTGPDAVEVSPTNIPTTSVYTIDPYIHYYQFIKDKQVIPDENPTITLARGGTYYFVADQKTNFYIQTAPGVSGFNPKRPNESTREVFGVQNNGESKGTIIFNVPRADAQAGDVYDGLITVDLATELPFDNINGKRLSEIGGIDGVTQLNDKKLMFFGASINSVANIDSFYDFSLYDEDTPDLIGFDQTIPSVVTDYFYKITYESFDILNDPIVKLERIEKVPTNKNIEVLIGTNYSNKKFIRNAYGEIVLLQPITAPIDTLYYQDSVDQLKFGTIKLIDLETNNYLNIENEILGKKAFTSPNGVIFTNGLKITFSGNVVPESYKGKDFYVDGVGESIILLPVSEFVTPEPFSTGIYTAYDSAPYDTTVYSNILDTPTIPDYITISRKSRSRNPWSRSNRWFHLGVLQETIKHTSSPALLAIMNSESNRAKRPIIEFYPNLKLYNSGTDGKQPIDFIDFDEANALSSIAGRELMITSKINGNTNEIHVDNTSTLSVGQAISFAGDMFIYPITAKGAISATTLTVTEVLGGMFYKGAAVIGDGILSETYIVNQLTATNIAAATTTADAGSGATSITVASGAGIAAGQYIKATNIPTGTYVSSTYVSGTTVNLVDKDGIAVGTTGNLVATAINFYVNATTADASSGATSITVAVAKGITADQYITGAGIPVGTYVSSSYVSGSTTVPLVDQNRNPVYTTAPLSTAEVRFNTAGQLGTYTVNLSQSIGTTTIGSTTGVTVNTSKVYYVKQITSPNTFTICETFGGDELNLATSITIVTIIPYVVNGEAVFDGATVVFASDNDIDVRNKIYLIKFITLYGGTQYYITLTKAPNGDVEYYDQTVVVFSSLRGKSYYFDGSHWLEAQSKTLVNQPPMFDIYDMNGTSLDNHDYYDSSDFIGSTLFQYATGTGANDPVLGFPLKYSSVNNVGDISFDASLNTESFHYVENGLPVTQSVNLGYPIIYTDRYNYTKQLGWQTAASPSFQYQAFDFTYYPANNNTFFVCDVPVKASTSTAWPVIRVTVGENTLASTEYTYTINSNSTTVTLASTPLVETPVQILIFSDSVSATAYYVIPTNLENNVFNNEVTTVNLGDIRNHFQTIFMNSQKLTGNMFGANNYRDVPGLLKYGTKIIQSSAPLTIAGALLRNKSYSLLESLTFNANEYVKFKAILIDTINKTDYSVYQSSASILDDALSQISSYKTDTNAFFWSDMLPSRSAYITNNYTFATFVDTTYYPLSKIYDFTTANYNGVLVYLSRTVNGVPRSIQLVKDVDYIVSVTEPKLTVLTDLIPNDIITIDEYTQTYGSYVPNTPTKLGFYPISVPEVVYDETYVSPAYFIKGHDGSYTKLYGDLVDGFLVDFRDRALFEFELRIYNNIKVSAKIPVTADEVIPGQFRTTNYTYAEILSLYSTYFLNWVGKNRIDYKSQYYTLNNAYTYNYSQSGNRLDNAQLKQGNWRGIYNWFFDTTTPNLTPWEMIGYSVKPSWWDSRYGVAPYTSDNMLLWQDMENGVDYNDGNPFINPLRVRPGLMTVLPVDSMGNLIDPMNSIIGNYDALTFNHDWKVGDWGPAEYSYLKSSTYPFDLIKMLALCKPAKFFALGEDLDDYKFNTEFGQYLYKDRFRFSTVNAVKYGSGTAQHSYLDWVVDYIQSSGNTGYDVLTNILSRLDTRLVYRMAGFSDKTLLKFYVDKGSPNSKNNSLLIPDESYSVILHENQPFETVTYSSVIVQKTDNGYKVFGNSQNKVYFKTFTPIFNGKYDTVTVGNETVQLSTDYSLKEMIVPYNAEFLTLQALCEFLSNYGKYLTYYGFIFDTIERGVPLDWPNMIREVLYWVQAGWEIGSLINVNPAAHQIIVNKENSIVQPLTLQDQNYILNQNLIPIQLKDMNVSRDGTLFTAQILNTSDTASYFVANLSNIEHAIVFDNTTLFNDLIFDPNTGLRQYRILVKGVKTAEWTGTMDTKGFILNQDNIQEWQANIRYSKGVIVKYKNVYWAADDAIQPAATFQQTLWKRVDYEKIQKGMLPNASNRAYESTLYYDANAANLENDADLLSFSLIGYRPRNYLAAANLDDISQVNLYKTMIVEKGSLNAASAIQNITLQTGGITYDTYENWAIQVGQYGGILNKNFVEFALDQSLLSGNPGIIGITRDTAIPGATQIVPLNGLTNYGRSITNTDILPLLDPETTNKLPSAGYVNFNDVTMYSYNYLGLNNSTVKVNELYKNEYVWVADYRNEWQVYTPEAITFAGSPANVINIVNNLNGTATVTFSSPHGLVKNDLFIVQNYSELLDGFYIVNIVSNLTTVVVDISLAATAQTSTPSVGIAAKLISVRVGTAKDIPTTDLLNSEFVTSKVWVDEAENGGWAVYKKTINYKATPFAAKPNGTTTFGSAVAYDAKLGYFVSDATAGNLYRYKYFPVAQEYSLAQTITGTTGFGSAIAHADDVMAVTKPGSTSYIYIYALEQTKHIEAVVPQQTITISSKVAGYKAAISGDKKYLFVPATNNAQVLVYRLDNKLTYTSTGYVTNAAVAIGAQTFSVAGNHTAILVEGDKVAFSNTSGTTIYKCIKSYYDSTNAQTIFSIEGNFSENITSGTIVYKATYNYSSIATISVDGLGSSDNFGYSLSTNYDGSKLFIGAPNQDYNGSYTDTGYVYVFDRVIQNFYQTYDTLADIATTYTLAYTASNIPEVYVNEVILTSSQYTRYLSAINDYTSLVAGSGYTDGNYRLALTNVTGSGSGAEAQITVSGGAVTNLWLTNRGQGYAVGNQLTAAIPGGSNFKITVASIKNLLTINVGLNSGDIVTFSSGDFIQSQTLVGHDVVSNPRVGVLFGRSLSNNSHANELIVGAPYDVTDNGTEGSIYRFTNEAKKYGMIIGTSAVSLASPVNILINGYEVTLPIDINGMITTINNANLPNIQAIKTSDNKLIISLIDAALSPANDKLNITVFDSAVWDYLGFKLYTKTQIMHDLNQQNATQFGYELKFNEYNSFVVSSLVGTRYSLTSFDFTDDGNYTNDTLFDNNFTVFVDALANAGSAYMYDYISTYNENINNVGQFVLAQTVNDNTNDIGNHEYYGESIAFNDYVVMIGSPNYKPGTVDGRVTIFFNKENAQDWAIYRNSGNVVDVNKLQSIQIFNNQDSSMMATLDYIDPIQGKLFGVVRENLNYIVDTDPAGYNTSTVNNKVVWGSEFIGSLWLDISSIRFVDYHQQDFVYNSRYWGTVFPGSTVAVYTWTENDVPPTTYAGAGKPYDVDMYTILSTVTITGTIVTKYYYWVRNTNVVYSNADKTLSDTVIESYITDPLNSGIPFFAAYAPNVFGLYNTNEFINAKYSSLHIGYELGTNEDPAHNEFQLIRDGYAGDFLHGLPTLYNPVVAPEGLYRKLLDSLSGTDVKGHELPDPFLPKLLQLGTEVRPRQSFFLNRLSALENYCRYANSVMIQYPIVEMKNPSYSGFYQAISAHDAPAFFAAYGDNYDTANYWQFVNWWATGYSDATRTDVEVPKYYDLEKLTPFTNMLAGVISNSEGKREVYVYTGTAWERVGLQGGTIQIKESLWDYTINKLGFGDNFFDTDVYDNFPSVETENIVRGLTEEVFTGELEIYRNKSLILLFEYIVAESQNYGGYLTWLNKTSFLDVQHTLRELVESKNFQRDNDDFLYGYMNEIKPYRVVLKEFSLRYTKTDLYDGDISDFDLPASYNTTLDRFISPQLVFTQQYRDGEYLPTDTIWQNNLYNQWFNNYGVVASNIPDYNLGTLKFFISETSRELVVDNAFGYPTVGIIKIDDEIISYTGIDRDRGILYGVIRAESNTQPAVHYPGSKIYTDLPGAVIFYTGRAYQNAPVVSAYIDTSIYPAPTQVAILKPIMSADKVVGIDIVNPGSGYSVTPEIRVQPSIVATFDSVDVNFNTNTISVPYDDFITGDLIKFNSGTTAILGLENEKYYYVGLTEYVGVSKPASTPDTAGILTQIALYTSKTNAISDSHRVKLVDGLDGTGHQLSLGARVIPIASNKPTRQLTAKLKFDRTSYSPQVIEWVPGGFYGAIYNTLGNDASYVAPLATTIDYYGVTGTPFSGSGHDAVFNIFDWVYGGKSNPPSFTSSGDKYGVYTVEIASSGLGYAVNNLITISGADLGGASPANNCVLIVTQVGVNGEIEKVQVLEKAKTIRVITIASGKTFTTSAAHNLVINDVVISATTTHGLTINTPYFVFSVPASNTFTLSDSYNGSEISTFTNGTSLTIDLTVNTTAGVPAVVYQSSLQGSTVRILSATTESGTGDTLVTLDYANSSLYPAVISGAQLYFYKSTHLVSPYTFDNSITNGAVIKIYSPKLAGLSISNQYYIEIISAGSIYSSGDKITVQGNLLGGTTPANDLVITITYADGGAIIFYSLTGVTPNLYNHYFVKPINSTQVKLYTSANLITPIKGSISYTTNDIAFYPEPIAGKPGYNQPSESLVAYNHKLYRCIESNTDTIFDYNKWQLLDSDSPIINALDRTLTYYQPTDDMPGNNLALLMKGLDYPNSTYSGKNFTDDTTLDFELKDKPFYPHNIDVASVIWDGNQFIAVGNTTNYSINEVLNITASLDGSTVYVTLPYNFDDIKKVSVYNQTRKIFVDSVNQSLQLVNSEARLIFHSQALAGDTLIITTYFGINEGYSIILYSTDGINWTFKKLSDQFLDVKDIKFSGSFYVVATNNIDTPIIISYDSYSWSSVGAYTGFDILQYDEVGFDTVSIQSPKDLLNSIAYYNNQYVAVGQDILSSINSTTWNQTFSFGSRLPNKITSVAHVQSIPAGTGYTGFIAVGYGDTVTSGADTSYPVIEMFTRVLLSYDGITWNDIFTGIQSRWSVVVGSPSMIITASLDGEIFYSHNGSNWTPSTITGLPITTAFNHGIYANNNFVLVGDYGMLVFSPDGITWTQIPSISNNNLRQISFDGAYYIVVGDNSTILRSSNLVNWESETYITTEDTFYTIKGDPFLSGYGPEELVPSLIYDNLSMVVRTTPGSLWDPLDYNNYGFPMAGKTLSYVAGDITKFTDGTSQFSFANILLNPAHLAVYIVDTTGYYQSTRIYETASVTTPNTVTIISQIDWVNKTVTIASGAIDYQRYLIYVEVYGVGSGNQQAKGSSDSVPIQYRSDFDVSYIETDYPYDPNAYLVPLVYINGIKKTPNVDYNIVSSNRATIQIQFESVIDVTTQYVNYTICGTTQINDLPQRDYSIPEIEIFQYTSGAKVFALTNYVGDTNPLNALVELNGVRMVPVTDYTITGSTLTVTKSLSANDVIAVTSYADTQAQYFVTDLSASLATYPVVNVNTLSVPLIITTTKNNTLANTDSIIIDGVQGSTQLNNTLYYVKKLSTYVESGVTYYPFELYEDPDFLFPVIPNLVSKYTGGGYFWKATDTFQITNISFDLTDESRLFVTVDGKRITPDNLRLNPTGLLNIMTNISVGNKVLVTSFMQTATPDEESYLLNVNRTGYASVYNANINNRTWLTQPLYFNDTVIHLFDVAKLIDTEIVNAVAQSDGNKVYVDLPYLIDDIKEATTYNKSTFVHIPYRTSQTPTGAYLITENSVTKLVFPSNAVAGDNLEVTLRFGDKLLINGEKISFSVVNYAENTVSGLIRGVDGTPAVGFHDTNSFTYSLTVVDKLPDYYYDKTWNSEIYSNLGDPLQISDTYPANFLRAR